MAPTTKPIAASVASDICFEVPLARLRVGPLGDFPLYSPSGSLQSQLSLLFRPLQVIDEKELNMYRAAGMTSFRSPREFLAPWKAYLGELPTPSFVSADQKPNWTAVVDTAKFALNKMLNGLETDPACQRAAMEECQRVTAQLIDQVLKNDSLNQLYATLTQAQNEEHSVAVCTLSMTFAVGLGIRDREILADLSLASLVHDIGLLKISPAIRQKPESRRSPEEAEKFSAHVQASLKVLTAAGYVLSSGVENLILTHHESWDGTGYPAKISGEKLSLATQVLIAADRFTDLASGEADGIKRNPCEAFAILLSNQQGRTYFAPDFLNRLSSFALSATDTAQVAATPLKRSA